MRSFLAVCMILVLCVAAPAQESVVLPLNEGWRGQLVESLEAEPSGEWQDIDLPHTFGTRNYMAAWYEKTFQAPDTPSGSRALLHFGGVKYNSEIWLNGKKVGGHFGGYDAFEVDATSAFMPGKENVLRVGCRDWTGLFSPGDKVDIPPPSVHRILTELGAQAAAEAYEETLRAQLSVTDGRFDLVLLGMGSDAHTASLFPGTKAVDAPEERWCVANVVPQLGVTRITLTYSVLNAARLIIFLVTGGGKAEALRSVFLDPPDRTERPAQGIRAVNGEVIWLVDEAAAALLPPESIRG